MMGLNEAKDLVASADIPRPLASVSSIFDFCDSVLLYLDHSPLVPMSYSE